MSQDISLHTGGMKRPGVTGVMFCRALYDIFSIQMDQGMNQVQIRAVAFVFDCHICLSIFIGDSPSYTARNHL